jgi:hypothetical protein
MAPYDNTGARIERPTIPEEELQRVADDTPNLVVNKRRDGWVYLKPHQPGYDDTWGTGERVNPFTTEWLGDIYRQQGWDWPTEWDDDPDDTPITGNGTGTGTGTGNSTPGDDYVQPEYLYYGDSPDQDWAPDLSYLRDAPAFKFEAEEYVPGEAFRAYERPDAFSYAAFEAPAPFEAPTGEEVLAADPGYQFRLSEGLRALENRAAQRGTLRSGATLQALMDYGQDTASQEYDKAYNRASQDYERAWRNRLQDYQTNRANLADAYATNLGARERGYGLSRDTDLMNEARQRDAYMQNYRNRYQVAQDKYKPQLASWSADQSARQRAAEGTFGRQWDAYRYAQPSASEVYTYLPAGYSS